MIAGKAVYRSCCPFLILLSHIHSSFLNRILCLRAQFPQKSISTRQKIDKMVTLLEHHLFQMAPTLADYANVRTLELRLKIALPRARASLRKQQQHPNQRRKQQQNRQSLQQSLGEERFQQVDDLVQTIRYERAELVGASCAKCQFIRRQEGKPELVGAASFGTEFPAPVKHLFFASPLVALWDKALLQRQQHQQLLVGANDSSTTTNWEPLMEQAQTNLQAFYEWKAHNFICQR
jgi:hypothetical protein